MQAHEAGKVKHILSVLFRRKLLISAVFVLVVCAAAVFAVIRKPTFKAEMKLLVTTGRANPVISAETDSRVVRSEVSEPEVNSEVELLNSPTLVEQTVVRCNLFHAESGRDRNEAIGIAARRLRRNLTITPARRANVIQVAFSAPSAAEAVSVLRTLGELYLEAHLRVHRTPGTYDFFRSQAEQYQNQMRDAEARLTEFQATRHVVLLGQQKELAVRNAADMRKAVEENRALLAETDHRIADLRRQLAGASARVVTQQRVSSNQYSVERLNTLLAELQNRRAELLTKFQEGDRLVQEVDEKIRNTTSALERAEKMRGTEQQTDVNPVVTALETELARAQFSRAGLAARDEVLSSQLASHLSRIDELNGLTAKHDELERTKKEAESNYFLYAKKQEEARMADSLDVRKIGNVRIAEGPMVPQVPRTGTVSVMFAGVLLAAFVSVGAALGIEHMRGCYYTPAELEAHTGLRVIATAPLEIA
jgi:uncharacterized protein involved in exopolysaccharide biosynthesis